MHITENCMHNICALFILTPTELKLVNGEFPVLTSGTQPKYEIVQHSMCIYSSPHSNIFFVSKFISKNVIIFYFVQFHHRNLSLGFECVLWGNYRV